MPTYKIDCHDCDLSKVVFAKDVAEGKAWHHERQTGHDVDYGELNG